MKPFFLLSLADDLRLRFLEQIQGLHIHDIVPGTIPLNPHTIPLFSTRVTRKRIFFLVAERLPDGCLHSLGRWYLDCFQSPVDGLFYMCLVRIL